MSDSSDSTPVLILGKASGYGILIGVGALFAIGMILTTKLLSRYLHEDSNSTEYFTVANRNIGKWLMASSTYSSWTWATEFLFVNYAVYSYGIQSSFYYSAGLCIQMCLMNLIGIHCKKKVPTAHTSLEIIELRYGKTAHVLFVFLCLVTNLLSCCTMIVGAAGAISIIAGNLHIVASTMLIPFGVLIYTTFSGLKGTFITDFVHSLVLLIVLCYITTSVLVSDEIGGLDNLYDLVIKHDLDREIAGNYKGAFLTGKTQGGIFFGLILTIGNFGLTIMDSSFWQKAFSATPKASCPGYLTAAVAIFSNAWSLGAIVGSACLVLEGTPSFPTYPRKMTQYEVDSGFVLPYTIKATLGDNAVGALLLIIYLAVTSTVSAQLISVSSIVSFDIYKKYLKTNANNKQIITVSHATVIGFGLFSAGFSVMLHYVGCNMTWLGYFLSMLICPGIFPMIFTIMWDRQTKLAAIVSPIVGMAAGLAIWLSTAYLYYGSVTIESTNGQLPCLFGGLTALFLPGLLSIIISLAIKPYKYDWNHFREAQLTVQNDQSNNSSDNEIEISNTNVNSINNNNKDNDSATIESSPQSSSNSVDAEKNDFTVNEANKSNQDSESLGAIEDEDRLLERYRKIAIGAFFFTLIVTWVLWPLSLYRDWIWTRAYFKGYITVGLIWLYTTMIVIGFFPLWEGRHGFAKIFKGLYHDYIKKDGKKATQNFHHANNAT